MFTKAFKVFADVHGEGTDRSECYLQAGMLSIPSAARFLCDLLKHDAQNILHWNEVELHLLILR